MPKFFETKYAGRRAEQLVEGILREYTKHVYTNVRVDTLYTKTGTTEVDIVAAVSDVLLIVEVKNVQCIYGRASDSVWEMYGAERGEPYTALNVFTQNRIHVRAIKDAWFSIRKEFPVAISVVVVPNNCSIPEELHDSGVLTVSEFSVQVADLCIAQGRAKYGYALDYLIGHGGGNLHCPDFVGGNI